MNLNYKIQQKMIIIYQLFSNYKNNQNYLI